jgi:predicted enzyme related to lactoylglutathione lyase
MNPVVYFEIPVLDLTRASDFYSAVFETTLTQDVVDGYQMAFFESSDQSFGATGALVVGDVYMPSHQGCFLYFGVESIDETVARALEHGGSVLYPKKSNGDLGFVAEIQDTEGNRIALHEEKK